MGAIPSGTGPATASAVMRGRAAGRLEAAKTITELRRALRKAESDCAAAEARAEQAEAELAELKHTAADMLNAARAEDGDAREEVHRHD